VEPAFGFKLAAVRRGTYSIVARDSVTGQIGVAVQSHWFAVGTVVSWAEPGVGAVATQSIAERSYGPNALDLLRAGTDAQRALLGLTVADEGAEVRQVAIIDARGRAAVHTGSGCVPEAGHCLRSGFCCQANMMASATVPESMATAFGATRGTLAERLLAALDAAEADGGDVRGRQSAALLVVPPQGERWRRLFDLRVDDHPDPLAELRRLHGLQVAYDTSEQAEQLVAEGRHDEAAPLFERAAELAPDNDELLFWAGLGAGQGGDLAVAVERVRAAAALNPRWLELLGRLPPQVAPSAADVKAALDRAGAA
jgi:uncharacterized Ntn-hydrolase superfamily protein